MPVTLAMSAATDCGSRLLLRYCTQKQKKKAEGGLFMGLCLLVSLTATCPHVLCSTSSLCMSYAHFASNLNPSP